LIDETSLADTGRDVCCAVCHHIWFQPPSTRNRDSFPGSSGLRLAPLQLPPKRYISQGWTVYGLAIVMIFNVGFFARDTMVNFWPPLQKLYDGLSLTTHLDSGFVHLEKVKAHYAIADAGPQLIMTGSIVNTSQHTTHVPMLKICFFADCTSAPWWRRALSLLSQHKGRCEVGSFSYKPSESRLLPGQRFMFETPGHPPFPQGTTALVAF